MVISRMPSWAKEIVINKANEEHCGDYGAAIAQLTRDALEYNCLKEKFFQNKLDVNILINDKHSEAVEEKENKITFASGKEIERRQN